MFIQCVYTYKHPRRITRECCRGWPGRQVANSTGAVGLPVDYVRVTLRPRGCSTFVGWFDLLVVHRVQPRGVQRRHPVVPFRNVMSHQHNARQHSYGQEAACLPTRADTDGVLRPTPYIYRGTTEHPISASSQQKPSQPPERMKDRVISRAGSLPLR